jgi:hypothetical protein
VNPILVATARTASVRGFPRCHRSRTLTTIAIATSAVKGIAAHYPSVPPMAEPLGVEPYRVARVQPVLRNRRQPPSGVEQGSRALSSCFLLRPSLSDRVVSRLVAPIVANGVRYNVLRLDGSRQSTLSAAQRERRAVRRLRRNAQAALSAAPLKLTLAVDNRFGDRLL